MEHPPTHGRTIHHPNLIHRGLPSRRRPRHDQPPHVGPTPPTSTQGAWTISPCHCLINLLPHPAPRHNPIERDIIFTWDTPLGSPLPAHVQNMIGPATVLNAPKCGSGAHRPTRIWQKLLPMETLDEAYSNLPVPSRTANDMLALAGLGSWHMPTGDTSNSTNTHPTSLPRFGTRLKPPTHATSPHAPRNGLLMQGGTLAPPSPEVREVLRPMFPFSGNQYGIQYSTGRSSLAH
jgi:hypothetical protein